MNRFNNVIFGQKAFILKDNKILIIKRSEVDMFLGMWDVPGGKIEENEILLEGLTREIKEEVGLTLEQISLVLTTSKFIGSKGDYPIIFRNIYLCSASGEIKLSSEHSEYKWVELDELCNYNFPNDPDFQSVIKRIPKIVSELDKGAKYSELF